MSFHDSNLTDPHGPIAREPKDFGRLFPALAFHGWTEILKASGRWTDGHTHFALQWTCGCVAERELNHGRPTVWVPLIICRKHRA
jgi:hypothetical protein